MSLKFAILGLLSTFGDSSGYDLKQRFTESVNNVWEADLSQIYRTLDRLERDEWVTSEADPDSNRNRKVYQITASGAAALREWLAEDYELAQIRDPALLRMFFADQISTKRLIDQVREYRAKFVELAANYDSIEQRLTELVELGWEPAVYQKFTLDLGHRYTVMTIEWCNFVLQELEQKQSNDNE